MKSAAHVQFDAQTKLDTLRREAREIHAARDLPRAEGRVSFEALRSWWRARTVRAPLPHA